jgi:uncharacterized membrane protein YsdA (DUF1294 family)/cold shock CspA family protein
MSGSDRADGITQDGAFRLSEWHDAKGYGWIDAGGKRVFAHIKDFSPGQRRPVAGDEVTFTPGTDGQGRPRAVAVRLMKQAGRIGPGAWGMLALLLVAPIAGGIHDGFPWWVVPAWYAVASAVAWCLYASDKRRAREGGWRVKETTLHLVEILGGWPGAFLAQRRFRHKTVKRSFQGAFWLAVAIHQFIAIDELTNSALIDAAWSRVSATAGGIGGDDAIAEAYRNQRSGIQVTGEGVVVKILPDDNSGSRHQRFILKLSSGQTLLIAHNIDLAARIPSLATGDRVAFHGAYEWNAEGGVVHWTHDDPNGRHAAGWVRRR